MAVAVLPVTAMADLLDFLRARLDEVGHIDWHAAECTGVPGPAGSCCQARAMVLRQAQTIRQRAARYERALAQSEKGPLGTAEFWKGAMTSIRTASSMMSRS